MTPPGDTHDEEISRLAGLIEGASRQKKAAQRASRGAFLVVASIGALATGGVLLAALSRLASGALPLRELAGFTGFFVAAPYFTWLAWKHRRLDREHSRDAMVIGLLGIASFTQGVWVNELRGVPLMMGFVVLAFMSLPRRWALAVHLYLVGLLAVYGVLEPVDFGGYLRALTGLGAIGPMMYVLMRVSHAREAALEGALQAMESAATRLVELRDASESKWKTMEALLDGSPEGVAFLDKGRFAYANRAFSGFSGLRAGDALPGMLLHVLSRQSLASGLAHGEEVRIRELVLRGADGQSRVFTATFRPGRYRELPVTMAWLQDVTEERKAQREAELEALANERIIESSPIGIGFAVGDIFHEGNDTLLDTFDMRPGESAWKLAHPEDAARLGRTPPADWPRAEEIRVLDREGRYRPCLVKGVRVTRKGQLGSVLWLVDLSAIRAAQAEAAIAHQRLLGALDSLPVLICLTDPEDRILFANRRLVGMHPEFAELLTAGRPYDDYIRAVGKSAGRDEAWIAARIAWRRDPAGDELVAPTMDGNRWLLRSNHRLVDGSIISIATDITDIKRAQSEMQRAKEAAEESARVKTDFIANMSHEIRTPMNAIIGMCYLAMQGRLGASEREHIDKAYRAAQGLLGILNDILDFSKLESGHVRLEPVEFRLGDLLASVASVTEPRARDKSLAFRASVAQGVTPVVLGDAARVKQVLSNLCDNAVKFTERGAVEVGVSQREDAAEGVLLEFCVRDTGIGIPAERQARLFDGFAQVDSSASRRFGGTGVGLGLAKRLVDLMGGRIWVESAPGAGSTFRFTVRFGHARLTEASAIPAEALDDTGSEAGEHAVADTRAAAGAPRALDAEARARLAQALGELRPLLEEGDASVVEQWGAAKALAADSAPARAISRHLETYDFEAALAALDAWVQALEAEGAR